MWSQNNSYLFELRLWMTNDIALGELLNHVYHTSPIVHYQQLQYVL